MNVITHVPHSPLSMHYPTYYQSFSYYTYVTLVVKVFVQGTTVIGASKMKHHLSDLYIRRGVPDTLMFCMALQVLWVSVLLNI